MTANPPDLDAVLLHADWLGRLSRQLCRDQHTADDAAQETLLASLRSPPRHDGNLRAFLANALRNVLRWRHRADARRRHREGNVPPPDFAEAVDLVAARAELHQTLGRLVLELPEPQRALVLLCYFEGQDVGAIAARSGMTRDAVQGHLRRARDTLRSRLQSSGSSCRGSAALLLLDRRLWLVPGALITMTVKTKIAAAAALGIAALSCWALLTGPPPTAPSSTPTTTQQITPAIANLAPPASATVERLEALPPKAAPGPVPAPAGPRGRLTGRVVDTAGTPVSPARVYALAIRDGKPNDDHVLHDDVDDLGQFELVPTFDGDVMVIAIPVQPRPSGELALRNGLVAVAMPSAVDRAEERSLGDVALPASVAITGTVRLPDNEPRAGVHVGWYPTDTTWGVVLDSFTVDGLAGGGVHVDVTRRVGGNTFSGGTATDSDGGFTIPTTPGMTGYVFLMNQSGEGEMERLVRERTVTAPASVVFDLLPSACVRVLTEGKPTGNVIALFELDAGTPSSSIESHRGDAAGEFRILRERLAPLRCRILRPGREPLEFDVPMDATPANPLVVDLGTTPTTAVQAVVTSEIPVRALSGSATRIDVPPSPISFRADPGSTVLTMRAELPPGPYRLVFGAAREATGDDLFVTRHVVDVTVGSEPVQVPVRLQHGGRIRVMVNTRDGQFVPGTIRLVDSAGKEWSPNMHAPGRGNGEAGKLWTAGPLLTSQLLATGRHEMVLDLGSHGTHRQFVDVRACAIADVTITLP